MKTLLFLTLCLVGGYYAYQHFNEKPPAPAAVVPPAVKPVPVDFAIKSTVRKLFEEWKRRSLAFSGKERSSTRIDPASELKEIRRKLFEKGIHSEVAVNDVIVRSLREIGVPEKDISEVAGGITGMQ
jgi:hypothetical protein